MSLLEDYWVIFVLLGDQKQKKKPIFLKWNLICEKKEWNVPSAEYYLWKETYLVLGRALEMI